MSSSGLEDLAGDAAGIVDEDIERPDRWSARHASDPGRAGLTIGQVEIDRGRDPGFCRLGQFLGRKVTPEDAAPRGRRSFPRSQRPKPVPGATDRDDASHRNELSIPRPGRHDKAERLCPWISALMEPDGAKPRGLLVPARPLLDVEEQMHLPIEQAAELRAGFRADLLHPCCRRRRSGSPCGRAAPRRSSRRCGPSRRGRSLKALGLDRGGVRESPPESGERSARGPISAANSRSGQVRQLVLGIEMRPLRHRGGQRIEQRVDPIAGRVALTMKVSSNPVDGISASAISGSSAAGATRSLLLSTSQVRRPASLPAISRHGSGHAGRPWNRPAASARSASCAPVQAAATIARSSRRRGAKMPGVSTSRTCVAPRMTMPSTRKRVVCAFGLTIESLAPVMRLSSVDFPAFAAPTMAAKPHREPCSHHARSTAHQSRSPRACSASRAWCRPNRVPVSATDGRR